MGICVYRETVEEEASKDDDFLNVERWGEAPLRLRGQVAIWDNDTSLTRVDSSYITGINPYSHRRYFRWQTDSISGIRKTKNGLLVGYEKGTILKKFVSTNSVFDWRGYRGVDTFPANPTKIKFYDIANNKFGDISIGSVYPQADHIYYTPQTNFGRLSGPLRKNTPREYIEALFGKSRYRKDLLKAVANTASSEHLLQAIEFKDLVPIDWIIKFLEANPTRGTETRWNYSNPAIPKNILARMDTRSYKKILFDSERTNEYILMDIARILDRLGNAEEIIGQRRYNSFDDLHDTLAAAGRVNNRLVYSNENIEFNALAKKLHGAAVGEMQIIAPENTDLMREWGSIMSNCIGSYARDAVRGNDTYLGVYSGDKLVANIEVRGKRLSQLLGRFNQSLPKDKKTAIVDALKEAGVSVDGDWWGK